MKTLLQNVLLVLIFVATGTQSASAQELPALAHQSEKALEIQARLSQRIGSYRRLILSSKGYGLIGELSDGRRGCGEAVRLALKKGGNFFSKHVDQSATRLGDFPKASRVQDDFYFHFTSDKRFMNSFVEREDSLGQPGGPVDETLAYRKLNSAKFHNSRQPGYKSLWGTLFYLSEDRESLAHWYTRAFHIQFTIDPNARLIALTPEVFDPALREIGERYPDVGRSCGTTSNVRFQDARGWVTYHPLNFIIAEESGIDAIDYQQQQAWFQIVSPEKFTAAKSMGRYHGGGTSENVHRGSTAPAIDLSYLTDPVLTVVSARYGKQDVTDLASLFIDGKANLDYVVSAKHLQVSAEELADADFELKVACVPGGSVTAAVLRNAKVFQLSAGKVEGSSLALKCR